MMETNCNCVLSSEEKKYHEICIHFTSENIPLIESGKKRMTYRFGEKFDSLNTGDIIFLGSHDDKNFCRKAIITEKYKTTFNTLPFDQDGHEKYNCKEHQRQVFSGYYNYLGRSIQDNDQFIVIKFQLIDNQECIEIYK